MDKYSNIPKVQNFDGIYLLDSLHMGNSGTVGVYLLPAKDGSNNFALIETGPGSTLNNIKDAIFEAGFKLENLKDILVTHIHLDHAGAAGALAAQTGAKVYVHEIGYKHLNDPSRLIASAKRIYKEKMGILWGDMQAIPTEQLEAITDNDILEVLGYKIKVLYTPGHARHHVSYCLDDVIFTGDSAAIKFVGSNIIRPAFPPPELDLDIWPSSLEKMLEQNPSKLFLTHFGEVKDAKGHLQTVQTRHDKWANTALEALKAKKDSTEIIKIMTALGEAELKQDNAPASVFYRHSITSDYEMTVMALSRYWQKFHPEMLL